MKKAIFPILTLLFLLTWSCKKEPQQGYGGGGGGGGLNPTSPNFADFEFSGIFRGSFYSAGSTSSIEGYITIDTAGATTLDLLSGRMKGTSVKTGGNYNITITYVTGIFQNVSNITGTIEISTRTLYLSGTNPDGSQVTIGGQTPEVLTTGGWENLSKSAVFFTHNESCKASVTINGVTLSGLNNHYESGGLCSSTYALWNTVRCNFDNEQSQIFCHNITLAGLNGQSTTYTDCNTIAFYLNKSTSYNYTVNWENGQTSSGSFTSPSGGGQLPICISNEGQECNFSLNDKWISSSGTGIIISGAIGSFYSFSSNWQDFVNGGFVSMGSANLKNISQVNSTEWNCHVLWMKRINGTPNSIHWATDGTIVMSSDGNTITVSATLDSGYGSATYTRVL
ncbi:MAG: hypothetical protein V4608_15810 [Bacteroidota bacterium]